MTVALYCWILESFGFEKANVGNVNNVLQGVWYGVWSTESEDHQVQMM